VGRHAAELISVIALAVTANLKVSDIYESLLVHPALSEALSDAAEQGPAARRTQKSHVARRLATLTPREAVVIPRPRRFLHGTSTSPRLSSTRNSSGPRSRQRRNCTASEQLGQHLHVDRRRCGHLVCH